MRWYLSFFACKYLILHIFQALKIMYFLLIYIHMNFSRNTATSMFLSAASQELRNSLLHVGVDWPWWSLLFLLLSMLFSLHCNALNVVYVISMFYKLFMICGPYMLIFDIISWINRQKVLFVVSEYRVGCIPIKYILPLLSSILLYQVNDLQSFSGYFLQI